MEYCKLKYQCETLSLVWSNNFSYPLLTSVTPQGLSVIFVAILLLFVNFSVCEVRTPIKEYYALLIFVVAPYWH